jgi:hypothetical protein
MISLEFWEFASYLVTVVGLPFGTAVFIYEQRRERQNEEAEIFQYLSEEYAGFQKLLLENADLALNSPAPPRFEDLTPEQQERKRVLYDILISLFERAYILVYEEKMSKQTQRLWASWEDYIRTWCQREDFKIMLPRLLQGEDEDFRTYILGLSEKILKS